MDPQSNLAEHESPRGVLEILSELSLPSPREAAPSEYITEALPTLPVAQCRYFDVTNFSVAYTPDGQCTASLACRSGSETAELRGVGTCPVRAILGAVSSYLQKDVVLRRYEVAAKGAGADELVSVEVYLRTAESLAVGEGSAKDMGGAALGACMNAFNALPLV